MVFYRKWDLVVAKQTYPGFTVTYGLGHGGYSGRNRDEELPVVKPDCSEWSVELAGVLWLLDQVEQGSLSVDRVRQDLLTMTDWESGCCAGCDEILAEWPMILAEQQARRAAWERWYASITPDSHPYTLNSHKTKIHRWDCARVAMTPPVVIEDRHRYVTRGHRVPDVEEYENRCHRITAEQARLWAGERARPGRCRVCVPALPGAMMSEVSDVASTY